MNNLKFLIAFQVIVTILVYLIGNFFFTFGHEKIHEAIFRELGGVNSTTNLGVLGFGAETNQNPNETVQNRQEVKTLQAVTEIYQYQIQMLLSFLIILFLSFSLSNIVVWKKLTEESKNDNLSRNIDV